MMALPEEELLHFIWRFRVYHTQRLRTISGEALTVLDVGTHNHHAGPDFLSARIRIGDTEWAGNIEIHVRASDWLAHHHQKDRSYNNVILHVVYVYDKMINREDGTLPETFELKPLIPDYILPKYQELMGNLHWIPCERLIHSIPDFQLSQWLSRLVVERFEYRVSAIFRLLAEHRGSWEETCYSWIARCFGFKVNAEAFEQLARSLPQGIVAKHRNGPLAIEALFFGQAGLLENDEFTDEYPKRLQQEYRYLRTLHALTPLDASIWKFMRTRPANFPTIRIAQFASLCFRFTHLFSMVINTADQVGLQTFFTDLPINRYWTTHYRFDVSSPATSGQIGPQSIATLLINGVAGILFAYGKYIGEETYIYRAIALLERLSSEENTIIRRFSALGISARHAAESQALLQLKTGYCDKKRCLACGIGWQLIKKTER